MNSLVELFRRDPRDRKFRSFEKHPLDSPGCRDAELNYRKVLTEGVLKLDDFIFDPLFPTSIVAGLLREKVTLNGDWFGNETILDEKLVFAKGLWDETNPNSLSGIHPGAPSALTEINETLFIARKVINTFIIHRPVISMEQEQILKQYLQKKVPDFFRE